MKIYTSIIPPSEHWDMTFQNCFFPIHLSYIYFYFFFQKETLSSVDWSRLKMVQHLYYPISCTPCGSWGRERGRSVALLWLSVCSFGQYYGTKYFMILVEAEVCTFSTLSISGNLRFSVNVNCSLGKSKDLWWLVPATGWSLSALWQSHRDNWL